MIIYSKLKSSVQQTAVRGSQTAKKRDIIIVGTKMSNDEKENEVLL